MLCGVGHCSTHMFGNTFIHDSILEYMVTEQHFSESIKIIQRSKSIEGIACLNSNIRMKYVLCVYKENSFLRPAGCQNSLLKIDILSRDSWYRQR
jgi:hypothetical protein